MPIQLSPLVGYKLRQLDAIADLPSVTVLDEMSCSIAGKIEDNRQTKQISASRQFSNIYINGNPKPDTLALHLPTSTELFRPQIWYWPPKSFSETAGVRLSVPPKPRSSLEWRHRYPSSQRYISPQLTNNNNGCF